MLVLCFVTTNIILDIRKRDELYMPLKKNENGHRGEKLLVEAVEIFKAWKSSGNIGLASETFTVCIHTIGAILELSIISLLHSLSTNYHLEQRTTLNSQCLPDNHF